MNRRDKEIQRQGSQQIQASAWSFSGPLPPPEILARYNAAFPEAAERIVKMAERQSEHRQNLEKLVVDSNSRAQARGQYLGFIIVMVAIVGGFALIWNGKDTIGISSVIASLIGLVTVFVIGRSKQKRELSTKAGAFGPKPVQ